MSRFFACAAMVSALQAMPSAALAGPDATVPLVIKFVKQDGHSQAHIGFDQASCVACSPITTAGYNADNPKEVLVAVNVPRLRSLELAFTGGPSDVKRVRIEGGDVPFHYEKGRWVVQVPPLASEAVTAGEYALHIVEPGMVPRLEHADPVRRAGDYRAGDFPALQRRAADTLEFAQRQVLRTLGLGVQAEQEHLGTIEIMGFDTNDPHGHTDSPPHVHMHLRWPNNTGTQIGHYYLDENGLLLLNRMGPKGLGFTARDYGKGETATSIAPDGKGLYAHTITREGWLQLGRAGVTPCLIKPLGQGGFETGALIQCPGLAPISLRVNNDLKLGKVTVQTDDVTEVFRYALDTGALTSPSDAPLPGPSVFIAH